MGVGAGRMGNPVLQRSFSGEGPVGVQPTSLFNNVPGGTQFQTQESEPEKNLTSKYRAFPDAYVSITCVAADYCYHCLNSSFFYGGDVSQPESKKSLIWWYISKTLRTTVLSSP